MLLSADHNYDWHGNRSRTGSINVAWQLMDVDETDGGFVYIPGGHKASLPLPTEHYSPRDGGGHGGGHAYAVGDDHDPDGLFGVVRPLLKAGVRSSFPFPFPLLSSSLPFPLPSLLPSSQSEPILFALRCTRMPQPPSRSYVQSMPPAYMLTCS